MFCTTRDPPRGWADAREEEAELARLQRAFTAAVSGTAPTAEAAALLSRSDSDSDLAAAALTRMCATAPLTRVEQAALADVLAAVSATSAAAGTLHETLLRTMARAANCVLVANIAAVVGVLCARGYYTTAGGVDVLAVLHRALAPLAVVPPSVKAAARHIVDQVATTTTTTTTTDGKAGTDTATAAAVMALIADGAGEQRTVCRSAEDGDRQSDGLSVASAASGTESDRAAQRWLLSGSGSSHPSVRSSFDGDGEAADRAAEPRKERTPGKNLTQEQLGELTARTVYLNRLDPCLTEGELREVLLRCGPILKVRLCGNASGRTRYGFAEFATREGARRMVLLDRTMLGSYSMRCLPARSPILDVDRRHDAIVDPRRGLTRACLFGLSVA